MIFFELPPLPYPEDSLKPYISEKTLVYHYGKHHRGYVNKLNKLLEENPDKQNKSLEVIIKNSSGNLFNNAAQAWNHEFYWNCLTPKGKKEPEGELAKAINATFGNFDEFKSEFKDKAASNFGSGWTWLVKTKNGGLKIKNTGNAENPMTDGDKPLLTCDVWEHAYYLDYQNERGRYIENFWHIVNWDFVEKQFIEK